VTRTVACFDFDGTLSTRDNFMPFVRLVAGDAATARGLLAAAPHLAAARRDPSRRDAAKAELVRRTFAGRRAVYVEDLGARYARLVAAHHLNPAVVARLEAHRSAGHDLVIVSASLTSYLDALSASLGVHHVFATELEVGADGRFTGEIVGANVRGAEKVRRIDAWLEDSEVTMYAYGNSDGDREMFERADHAVRVDRRGHISESAPGAPARHR
jgi:phosphatidylglycerophosphatase C